MTATERLRSMLDERGAEWDELVGHPVVVGTEWHDRDGYPCTALEHADDAPDGMLSVQANLTPEQAIAATLGDDEASRLRSCMAADADAHKELLAECGKLRELVRGLRYCAKEAYGMCARVPVGGEKPFTCCPLYDFDGNEHRCKKLMEELGVEI